MWSKNDGILSVGPSQPEIIGLLVTSAEREVKDSRRSGMYQSLHFLTRLGKQSL